MATSKSVRWSRQLQADTKHRNANMAIVCVFGVVLFAVAAFAEPSIKSNCEDDLCLLKTASTSSEASADTTAASDKSKLSLTLEKSFGQIVRFPNSRYCSLAISPDGAFLAAGECHPFGKVHIWALDGSDTEPLLEFEAQPCDPGCRVASPTSLAFSHDGTKLAAALFNNNVQVWDLKTGKALITLGRHVRHDDIHSIDVAFSPDDRIIATGSEPPAHVILWDAATGEELRRHPMSRLGSTQPFSADGRMVVLLTSDNTNVTFWSVETGKEETGGCLGTKINSAAFSTDGKLVAITGNTHVEFWKLQPSVKSPSAEGSGEDDADVCPARKMHGFQFIPPPRDPNGRPQPVMFSPDGRWFIAFRDDRLIVWDAMTLHELINRQMGYVASAAFGPGGTTFATIGGYGDELGIRVWTLED